MNLNDDKDLASNLEDAFLEALSPFYRAKVKAGEIELDHAIEEENAWRESQQATLARAGADRLEAEWHWLNR